MSRHRTPSARLTLIAGMAAVSLAAAGSLAATGTSRADAPPIRVCAPQANSLVDQLGAEYGETLAATGVDAKGHLLRVYANADSGTWTIAVTAASGLTCILTNGRDWVSEQMAEMPRHGHAL